MSRASGPAGRVAILAFPIVVAAAVVVEFIAFASDPGPAPARPASQPVPPAESTPKLEFPATSAELLDLRMESSPLSSDCRAHYSSLVAAELKKYPRAFLDKYVHRVQMVGQLRFRSAPYGGTSTREGAILMGLASPNPATDLAIRSILHAEISSILFTSIWTEQDTAAWNAALPSGFVYGHDEIAFVSKPGSYEVAPNGEISDDGFLNSYSRTCMENDFNAYASALLLGNARLPASQSSSVRAKLGTALGVYQRACPAMDADYFRRIAMPAAK